MGPARPWFPTQPPNRKTRSSDSRTALKTPILYELIAEHVYVVRSSGVLQAGDDLGDGRVGMGHAFGEGAPDLIDEFASGRGVGVKHLEQTVPAHAVRLDPRNRL